MILRHNVSLLYINHTRAVDTIGGDGNGKLDRAHSFPDFGVRLGEQEIDRGTASTLDCVDEGSPVSAHLIRNIGRLAARLAVSDEGTAQQLRESVLQSLLDEPCQRSTILTQSRSQAVQGNRRSAACSCLPRWGRMAPRGSPVEERSRIWAEGRGTRRKRQERRSTSLGEGMLCDAVWLGWVVMVRDRRLGERGANYVSTLH